VTTQEVPVNYNVMMMMMSTDWFSLITRDFLLHVNAARMCCWCLRLPWQCYHGNEPVDHWTRRGDEARDHLPTKTQHRHTINTKVAAKRQTNQSCAFIIKTRKFTAN